MIPPLKMQVKVIGSGMPLLLVPGGLTGWKSWEPFVDLFSAKNKQVICVQLLNVEYGVENRPLPIDYSLKTESNALAATIDSLGYSNPLDIVAWSYGVLTTLDYALDYPQKIRTLTLIEPPAIWVLSEQIKSDPETQQTLNFFKTLHGDISDDMLAAFLQEVGFVKKGQSPWELPQWKPWLDFRQALRNSPAVVNKRDNVKRLQEFKKPVLLVKGTGSAKFLHQIIDGLASNLPDARVVEMPAGHAPHIVSRDMFLAELENFQAEQGQ
jgi:pimeloyl-ACP methyl ester carboxylesterase